MKLLAILLLCSVGLQAQPWPTRLAGSIGHNSKEAVSDCIHSWRMRFECSALIAANAFDAKSSADANHYYPNLQEADPLFGIHPSVGRIYMTISIFTFLELYGTSYVHRNTSHPWELIYSIPYSGLHVYSGIHNENLIEQCKHEGVCK